MDASPRPVLPRPRLTAVLLMPALEFLLSLRRAYGHPASGSFSQETFRLPAPCGLLLPLPDPLRPLLCGESLPLPEPLRPLTCGESFPLLKPFHSLTCGESFPLLKSFHSLTCGVLFSQKKPPGKPACGGLFLLRQPSPALLCGKPLHPQEPFRIPSLAPPLLPDCCPAQACGKPFLPQAPPPLLLCGRASLPETDAPQPVSSVPSSPAPHCRQVLSSLPLFYGTHQELSLCVRPDPSQAVPEESQPFQYSPPYPEQLSWRAACQDPTASYNHGILHIDERPVRPVHRHQPASSVTQHLFHISDIS